MFLFFLKPPSGYSKLKPIKYRAKDTQFEIRSCGELVTENTNFRAQKIWNVWDELWYISLHHISIIHEIVNTTPTIYYIHIMYIYIYIIYAHVWTYSQEAWSHDWRTLRRGTFRTPRRTAWSIRPRQCRASGIAAALDPPAWTCQAVDPPGPAMPWWKHGIGWRRTSETHGF